MDLDPVLNFGELKAGDVVPAGVCKHCNRLAYIATEEELKAHATRRKPGSFDVRITVHVTEEALALIPKDVSAPQILDSRNLVQRFISHVVLARSKEQTPLDAAWGKLGVATAMVSEIKPQCTPTFVEKTQVKFKPGETVFSGKEPPSFTISLDNDMLRVKKECGDEARKHCDVREGDHAAHNINVSECLEATRLTLAKEDDGVPGWWSTVTSLTNTMIRQWRYRIGDKSLTDPEPATPLHFEPGDVIYSPSRSFGPNENSRFAIVTQVTKKSLRYAMTNQGLVHLGSTTSRIGSALVKDCKVIGQRVFDGDLLPKDLVMVDPRKVGKHWARLNKQYPLTPLVFDLMGQLLTVGIRSIMSSYVSVCPIGQDPSKVENYVSLPSEFLIQVVNKQAPAPIAKKKEATYKLTKVSIAKVEPHAKPQVLKKAKPKKEKKTSSLSPRVNVYEPGYMSTYRMPLSFFHRLEAKA